MKIYWTLDMVPELAEFPKKERMGIWRSCSFQGLRHWQTWVGYALWGLVLSPSGPIIGKAFLQYRDSPYMILLSFFSLAPALITYPIALSIHIEQVRPYLREFIKKKHQT